MKNTKSKYYSKIEELIKEGEGLANFFNESNIVKVQAVRAMNTEPWKNKEDNSLKNAYIKNNINKDIEFSTWKQKCIAIAKIFKNNDIKEIISDSKNNYNLKQSIEIIGFLNSLKFVIDNDMFNIYIELENEIASDYMGQAERLLTEGQSGAFDHVPAAVLAGAVLEKTLKTLCQQQNPPVSLELPNGKPKTLNPLIDDLKKAGVFNEPLSKQLKAWTDIRNCAAHGEFEDFTREQIEAMIKGIQAFLASKLG